jgi:hypothetical protein
MCVDSVVILVVIGKIGSELDSSVYYINSVLQQFRRQV